jgi:hypothetical protein
MVKESRVPVQWVIGPLQNHLSTIVWYTTSMIRMVKK